MSTEKQNNLYHKTKLLTFFNKTYLRRKSITSEKRPDKKRVTFQISLLHMYSNVQSRSCKSMPLKKKKLIKDKNES